MVGVVLLDHGPSMLWFVVQVGSAHRYSLLWMVHKGGRLNRMSISGHGTLSIRRAIWIIMHVSFAI